MRAPVSLTAAHVFVTILLVLASGRGARASEFSPKLDLGVNFHTGDTGSSLMGIMGFFGTFRAEQKKGFFRPQVGFEMGMDSGAASVGSELPTTAVYNAGFHGGFHLFAFTDSKFAPFVGGSGIASWAIMKITSPPTGVEGNTQGLAFGYEVAAGVDMQGSAGGRAFRIRSSYTQLTTKVAGISGFQLSGFRISIGIGWP